MDMGWRCKRHQSSGIKPEPLPLKALQWRTRVAYFKWMTCHYSNLTWPEQIVWECQLGRRVLRRAGIAGILPAGVWLCRLERKFGRFLPAGIFRWFYVFAGWRSFCLSKTDPKRRNALVSILVVAEPSDGKSSSGLKLRLSTRARLVTVRVSRTARRSRKPCASDHVQVTQNAPRHFRSTQCCMRSRSRSLTSDSWTQDGVDRRIFRNARAAFGLSIAKKDCEDVENSGFVNFISFERYW